MKVTKILLISASLKIGGAEKVAADIGFHADPQRYEVHYVVFGDEIGAYEPELQSIPFAAAVGRVSCLYEKTESAD